MISDLYVRLSALTAPYTAALIEAGDEGEAFAEGEKTRAEAMKAANEESASSFGLIGKAAFGIGAALAGVSAISIKWATSFQSQMESIHTQAGVSQSQIASLSNGVLALAGQVGFSPDSLAEALYHIESSFASIGITGPKALDLLKIAAQGAAVGHANLVDVTNALDAAVASGIPGVQNFSQAMGVLNATVGAGDMQMQDLANAFSTGLLANVKSYGLSITDVGAALATFGDNNIRGQNAATELRMAVQALAVPAKGAASALSKMGLQSDSLAKVMSQKGLLPALQLLHDRMNKIGVTAQTQGQILTDMFGKKAGAGIVVLYDQLDRLKSKYPDLQKGASGFGDAWTATKKTVRQQLNEIGAGVQAAGIKFGQVLLPLVSRGLSAVTGLVGREAPKVGRGLSALWAGFTGKKAAKGASPTDLGLDQLGRVARGIANDFVTFGKDVVKAFGDLQKAAKPLEGTVGKALVGGMVLLGKTLANVVGPALDKFASFLSHHGPEIKFFAEVVIGGLIAKFAYFKTTAAIDAVGKFATSLISVGGKTSGVVGKIFNGHIFDDFRLHAMYAMDPIKKIGSTFAEAGGKIVTAVKGWGGSIATAAKSWGGKIGDAVKGVMPTKLDAKLFLQSVKGVGASAATTIKGWGSGIASAASSAASGLSTLASNAGSAVASFASSAWSTASDAVSGIGSALATAGSKALEFSKNALVATGSALKQAGAFVLEKGAALASAVAEQAAAAAQWLLNIAMDASPLTWIVIGIVALVAVFVLLWTKCAWFRDMWKGLWKDVVAAAKAAWSILWGDALKPMVDFFKTVVVGALHVAQDTWKAVWGAIGTATKAAYNWLDSNVFGPVKRVFTVDIPSALHTAENIWGTVWGGIKSAASTTWNWVNSNVLQPIENFFNSVLGGALHTGQSVWDSVWGGIQSTIQTVWSVIKPIFDAITSAASAVGSAISGVSSAASSVGHIAGSVVHNLNPLNWDEGGWVPGAAGSPVVGVVHGGEYVLSREMIAGTAPVDNRVMSGLLASGARPVGGGGVGGGSGGAVVNNFFFQFGGDVITTQADFEQTVMRAVLQAGSRNRNNGLAYARG